MLKKCTKCAAEKPYSEFYKDKQFKSGYSARCKACKDAWVQDWRINNREQYNSKMRAYNKLHYKRLRLQRYKLAVEAYDKMINDQQGKCKICDKEPSALRPLAIDHCHKTGRVRGLLCYSCNRALAILDNSKLLRAALNYLKS